MTAVKSIWQGVYASFDDAKVQNDELTRDSSFRSQRWFNNSLETFTKLRNAVAEPDFIHTFEILEQDPLPLATAMVMGQKPTVRILDFGGGIGCSAVPLLGHIPDNSSVEIVIVDNSEICEFGNELFSDEPRVSFSDELPQESEHFDIIHCRSSLQYVDDWLDILGKLGRYHADYILICDLPAGDIPTIVTLQIYYEFLIPVHFWNIHEFIAAMENLDYSLKLKAGYTATIRGVRGPLPMGLLPPENRLKHACHLLFSRKSDK